jgi:hypothetical protein
MPQATLYTWVQKGLLSCCNVGGGSKRAILVRADPETIVALKAIRATPPPWRRLPPSITVAISCERALLGLDVLVARATKR